MTDLEFSSTPWGRICHAVASAGGCASRTPADEKTARLAALRHLVAVMRKDGRVSVEPYLSDPKWAHEHGFTSYTAEFPDETKQERFIRAASDLSLVKIALRKEGEMSDENAELSRAKIGAVVDYAIGEMIKEGKNQAAAMTAIKSARVSVPKEQKITIDNTVRIELPRSDRELKELIAQHDEFEAMGLLDDPDVVDGEVVEEE